MTFFKHIMILLICCFGANAAAFAQNSCVIPKNLPRPQTESPPAGEGRKAVVTGNILALSWSPQFCRAHDGDARYASQCGVKGQFGFILHGLWPDGDGRDDPAWCAPAKLLSPDTIIRNFCMMPSVKLQQHEWAKHGTCAAQDPDRYFKAASILYGAMKWPDMNRLSYKRPSVAEFVQAFVAANPGLPSNAVRVDTTRGGWLGGVKICLNIDYRPRACARDMNGAPPKSRLKIWRDELKAIAMFNRR
jgi:ribonuclease T2